MTEHSRQQALFEKKALQERREIYHGKRISLCQDVLQMPDGSMNKHEIVVHPGAAVIIPVTQDGKIVLVKQWRRAVREILIELPAGTLESGEMPLICAQRELQEETGYVGEEWISLGKIFSSPGFNTEVLHLFLAIGLKQKPTLPDPEEAIDLVMMTKDEMWDKIFSGKIPDAKTIAGLAMYEQWLTKNKAL